MPLCLRISINTWLSPVQTGSASAGDSGAGHFEESGRCLDDFASDQRTEEPPQRHDGRWRNTTPQCYQGGTQQATQQATSKRLKPQTRFCRGVSWDEIACLVAVAVAFQARLIDLPPTDVEEAQAGTLLISAEKRWEMHPHLKSFEIIWMCIYKCIYSSTPLFTRAGVQLHKDACTIAANIQVQYRAASRKQGWRCNKVLVVLKWVT